MSTQYPKKIDTFVNPSATEALNGANAHHVQHANHNDAITAIEKYIGILDSIDINTITGRLKYLESKINVSDDLVAAIDLEKFSIIYINHNGEVELADAYNLQHSDAIGVVMDDTKRGDKAEITNNVNVTMDDWSKVAPTKKLTVGSKYFLADKGNIIEDLNDPKLKCILNVGFAINPTTLRVTVNSATKVIL